MLGDAWSLIYIYSAKMINVIMTVFLIDKFLDKMFYLFRKIMAEKGETNQSQAI